MLTNFCQVFTFSVFGLSTQSAKDWLKERLKKEGFLYSFSSPNVLFAQCSGLLILSKFPLEEEKNKFISYRTFAGIEIFTSKGALKCYVKVDPNLPPLVIIDTHLQCYSGGENAVEVRKTQLKYLANKLLEGETNCIVAGDMNICARNDVERYKEMLEILNPVRDILAEKAYAQGNDSQAREVTMSNAERADESLDYVFLRAAKEGPRWEYEDGSCQVEKIKASDKTWGVSISVFFCCVAEKSFFHDQVLAKGNKTDENPGTISDHYGVSAVFYYHDS